MPDAPYGHVLFPGRHHLLTRFQAAYLRRLLAGDVVPPDGRPVAGEATLVFAVTSATHANTRRNPLEYARREAAIERFSLVEDLPCLAFPIPDTGPTDRFAGVVLGSIEVQSGGALRLDPTSTVVACSTPSVADMYRVLGFAVVGVEADEDAPTRPWTVLELLAGAVPSESSSHTVAGQPSSDAEALARQLAHPASLAVLDRYRLVDRLRMLFADPVASADAALTDTRDYDTYTRSFEDASERKWQQVAPHVRPGRILDIGCASGGLLAQAAQDPRLRESDLFGVELDRHLYAEAVHGAAQGRFANPNTFFLQRNILNGAVMADASVDTTLTVALTHEILSYGDGLRDLRRMATAVHRHTRPGGVWINADVLGPDDPDGVVELRLATDDGAALARPMDLEGSAGEEVAARVGALSTRGRFTQFATDFPRLSGAAMTWEDQGEDAVALPRRWAMEFMTRKDYVDNWLSECHERFCDLSFADWEALVTEVGFVLAPASFAWRNDWLVDNRFAGTASLHDPASGALLDWPDTHVLIVAARDF